MVGDATLPTYNATYLGGGAVVSPVACDGTNWKSIGGGGTGGTSITNGGATFSISATGDIVGATTDVASNTNQFSITTTVPSTTPGTNAGNVSIASGGNVSVTTGTGNMTLSGSGGGDVEVLSNNFIYLDTSSATGASSIKMKPNNSASVSIEPPTNYGAGAVLYNTGAFNNQNGYLVGSIVTSGGNNYVATAVTSPNTVSPYNPDPSAGGNWAPFGGGGGGVSTTISDANPTNPANQVSVVCGYNTGISGNATTNSALDPPLLIQFAQEYGSLVTLADDKGSFSVLAAHDIPGGTNQISLVTVKPTSSPGSNPGKINILSGGSLTLGGTDGLDIQSNGTIQITVGNGNYVNVDTQNGSTGYAGGQVAYFIQTAIWNASAGYGQGAMVNLNSLTSPTGTYMCIVSVPPSGTGANTSPAVTPANWVPIGSSGGNSMSLAPGANATWVATAGYNIGQVVNNSTPVGIFVCISAVAANPSGNLNPSADPTKWTELIAAPSPAGTSMVWYSAFNNAIGYSAQSVVVYNNVSYVNILATTTPSPPTVNANPDVATTNWANLTGTNTSWGGNFASPPASAVTYTPNQIVALDNTNVDGGIAPAYVAANSYVVGQVVSDPVLTVLTNFLCISNSAPNNPPASSPTLWQSIGIAGILVPEGQSPTGLTSYVNINSSSTDPRVFASSPTWTALGTPTNLQSSKYFIPGLGIPAVTFAPNTVNWITGVATDAPCIDYYTPQFIQTTISFNVAFSGTFDAGSEIYLDVIVYNLNAQTSPQTQYPTPGTIPLQQMGRSRYFTTAKMATALGTTPLQITVPVNAYFNPIVAPVAPSTAYTFNPYMAVAVEASFSGSATQIVITYDPAGAGAGVRNTGYWEFIPGVGQ